MAGVKGRSGGRNAKTVEQLKAEGTFDPSRHAGIENPLPVPGMPKPPAKLGKIARREWRRMVELLEANHTLSRELAGALYQYCRLFEEAEDIAAQRIDRRNTIERLEESIRSLRGESLVEAIANITKLVLLDAKDATQIRQYRLALRTYLVEFGLTPAARSRVKLVPTRQRPKTGGNEPSDPTPLEKLQAAQRKLRAAG
jgi:P27 family predicted phage terminase small subunit